MEDQEKRPVQVCSCDDCVSHPHSAVAKYHRAINRVLAALEEQNRRRFVGLLALEWGYGAVTLLSQITGLSRVTIRRGRAEVQRTDHLPAGRQREAGGGRQSVEKKSLNSRPHWKNC